MAQYIEDLVQNIYTNCDMSGLDKLNKGLADANMYTMQLDHNLRQLHNAEKMRFDFSAKASNFQKGFYIQERNKQKLLEYETKMRMRLHDYEDIYARRKARRDDAELRRMRQRNWLWRGAVRWIAAYFSFRTLGNIIKTGQELQLIQKSITGLTGSGQDWQFLDQQAYRFGLSLKTVSQGYKNFYSSASMAGFDRGQIQGMFSDMLLGARSIGASDQQIGGALLALEQMMSKGKVSMEELRRQLGNALPGAFEIGAKAMGVTTKQFNEMVKAGISAQEFVPKFIKTFKEQYANGWKDVEQTVAVAQGRLLESWEKFTMNFMHGEAGKALAQGINQLAEFMRSPAFYRFVDLLGKIFTLVVKLLTFVVKYLPIILSLLGTMGLLHIVDILLLKFGLLKLELRQIFAGGIINGIKMMGTAFWGLIAPIVALSAKALVLIGIILILQDLWKWFTDPNADTLIGRMNPNRYNEMLEKGVQYESPDAQKRYNQGRKNIVKQNQEMTNRVIQSREAIGGMPLTMTADKRGWFQRWRDSRRRIPIIPDAKGVNTGGAAPIDLDKEENNNISVSIGDINVYSNSNNPQQVAQEVQNQLVALFMGQGLMTNVGETVVG